MTLNCNFCNSQLELDNGDHKCSCDYPSYIYMSNNFYLMQYSAHFKYLDEIYYSYFNNYKKVIQISKVLNKKDKIILMGFTVEVKVDYNIIDSYDYDIYYKYTYLNKLAFDGLRTNILG